MNTKKNIGFVAHGPGSANCLKPIIELIGKYVNIHLFAFHPYVAEKWGCNQFSDEEFEYIFEHELDLVVYGTGSGHTIELTVAEEANKRGIPSLSILDCYWADDKNLLKRYAHPPTYLVVPTEDMKERIETLGILPAERVLSFGNPHFDRLRACEQEETFVEYPLQIVFFSQCSTGDDYSDTNSISKEALLSLIAFKEMHPELIKEVFVTPHPREDGVWLSHICKEHQLTLRTNAESFKLMLSTDLSVGCTCTLQYEALCVKKPTIFYENREDLFDKLFDPKTISIKSPHSSFHATEKCIEFIREFTKNKI